VKLTDLKAGDCVWIDDFGTHPGVVIHNNGTSAVVIRGTGTGRAHIQGEICISEKTPAGTSMGLNKPTYFNATRFSVIYDAAKITRKTGKKCPINVFTQLEALMAPIIAKSKALIQAQQQQAQQHAQQHAQQQGQQHQSAAAASKDAQAVPAPVAAKAATDPDPK
jgi:hypothetical protein